MMMMMMMMLQFLCDVCFMMSIQGLYHNCLASLAGNDPTRIDAMA
jgi:hypothetical protein